MPDKHGTGDKSKITALINAMSADKATAITQVKTTLSLGNSWNQSTFGPEDPYWDYMNALRGKFNG